jgi:hypothetical protein
LEGKRGGAPVRDKSYRKKAEKSNRAGAGRRTVTMLNNWLLARLLRVLAVVVEAQHILVVKGEKLAQHGVLHRR